MEYQQRPKIELHVHLDTSLSYEVVKELRPGTAPKYFNTHFIAPPKCEDLADYIARAESSIQLMQTWEGLRAVTLDLFRQFQADNVIYAEVRFAPLEHTRMDLTAEQVVQAVNDAVVEGHEKTGIQVGVILCTLRHFSEQQSMQTVQLVEQFKAEQVCGFDIAADEVHYPIDNHISAFEYAQEHQLNRTAHAGEARGAESVWETLNHFKPHRIGHGVRSVEDPMLLDYLKEHFIHLEVCPTSNVQTDVFDKLQDHSLPQLKAHQISVGINTDGRGLSNVTLADEYNKLNQTFGWNKQDFLRCNLEALKHAFTTPERKAVLRERLIDGYQVD
ncbi:MAG: adenosine deaminase [Bacteroidota bacterium]